jgi:Flp pilus assembly pilin Flp
MTLTPWIRTVISATERGQNVVEYGLLIATIVLVVLLGITAFGRQIEPWFAMLAGRITTVGT